jgi:hypothetical protein
MDHGRSRNAVTDHFDSTAILWCFGAVQALGLASAWLSRVSEGSLLQPWFQRLFLVSLLLSGVATLCAPAMGGVYWLISSATLGAMVVMAVCDFRQERRAFTM